MTGRAAAAVVLVLAVAGAVVLSRRRALPAAATRQELEPLEVTAARMPEAGEPLEEIIVTATRLPATPITRAVDAVAAVVSEVVNVVKSAVVPRGIRNNNPGNLERTGIAWKGMSPQQGDPRFIVFSEPKWGVRALARVLKTYEGRGLDTVRAIVNRWAPPTENNTSAYVAAVARALGVSPDARIDVTARLPELAGAIIRHENGVNPYSAADVAEWVRLA